MFTTSDSSVPSDQTDTRSDELNSPIERWIDDRADAAVVTRAPEAHVLVHGPSGPAFDTTTRVSVFDRGRTAGRDADAAGE